MRGLIGAVGVIEITSLGIRAAFHDISRVGYVHGEIVSPDMTWADCGGVEDGNSNEKENEPEMVGCLGQHAHRVREEFSVRLCAS
jgi:hypothetical protein